MNKTEILEFNNAFDPEEIWESLFKMGTPVDEWAIHKYAKSILKNIQKGTEKDNLTTPKPNISSK